jgi:hypothetical protein
MGGVTKMSVAWGVDGCSLGCLYSDIGNYGGVNGV